ncbi:hypothetical protein JCM19231_841 [Vibrio ishigakensis]|uniref:Uncharacterized protein n=1 Tax=Vibrio ishigakensis TaxID=1481914 RepID=A0A0B8NV95_9VIBR|nr:hypothetical protein JCM19231_841 [Vibrio ishigakensis]
MSDAVNQTQSEVEEKSYSELHRPASEFASRSDYLDHELQIMNHAALVLTYLAVTSVSNLKTWFQH